MTDVHQNDDHEKVKEGQLEKIKTVVQRMRTLNIATIRKSDGSEFDLGPEYFDALESGDGLSGSEWDLISEMLIAKKFPSIVLEVGQHAELHPIPAGRSCFWIRAFDYDYVDRYFRRSSENFCWCIFEMRHADPEVHFLSTQTVYVEGGLRLKFGDQISKAVGVNAHKLAFKDHQVCKNTCHPFVCDLT